MNHRSSVFANSCLRRPVDPISKMPKTAYERKQKLVTEKNSIDSSSTPTVCSALSGADVDAEKLKDFYRSIPDYNDINHLPAEEFYLTLNHLRNKRNIMLGLAVDHIDDCNGLRDTITDTAFVQRENANMNRFADSKKYSEAKLNYTLKRKTSANKNDKQVVRIKHDIEKPVQERKANIAGTYSNKKSQKFTIDSIGRKVDDDLKLTRNNCNNIVDKKINKTELPKRNHSACSISWDDSKIEGKYEVDEKFKQFFEGNTVLKNADLDDEFKTQSMPSSPLRMKRVESPVSLAVCGRKNVTVPKPFKMTERDEEQRMVSELRSLRKSFSDDMLHRKCERKRFRAKPVPIESRIPLYDKILEDQAMRRAITKINSEAELRAQMKPFSFTKREEKGVNGMCERAALVLPKPKKKKRFKARPVPKNLFSNYFYNKTKEDEFFRSMNRRIRAEEMLRAANLPGNMALRDRSRLSTPAAHSDLPIDPSPVIPSVTSSNRQGARSPTKERKRREKKSKDDFITTSPHPFRFNTADRAAKKMQEITKLYQESKSTESIGDSRGDGAARAYSALELRSPATGRSNLAALLRAEAVRRRFEVEAAIKLAEQRRRIEMKNRDRLLRSNPAWHLVKNNHEEDIAMRLQTRRDEERMRREEFLHEMELMYGRVQQQPMLFERYYAPRPYATPVDYIQLSPRKNGKTKKSTRKKSCLFNSPTRSRKVCINDTAEAYNGNVIEYLNQIDNDDKLYSDSEAAIDSIDGGK